MVMFCRIAASIFRRSCAFARRSKDKAEAGVYFVVYSEQVVFDGAAERVRKVFASGIVGRVVFDGRASGLFGVVVQHEAVAGLYHLLGEQPLERTADRPTREPRFLHNLIDEAATCDEDGPADGLNLKVEVRPLSADLFHLGDGAGEDIDQRRRAVSFLQFEQCSFKRAGLLPFLLSLPPATAPATSALVAPPVLPAFGGLK
jgi:hypothetical protein